MKRILIIFGATGRLGTDAVSFFYNKNYDHYYLVSRSHITHKLTGNYTNLLSGDLTKEENVDSVFSKIKVDEETEIFLFSTIGTYLGNKYIHEIDYGDWLNILNINLNTSFLIAKHFSKLMLKCYGGSICFTSAYSATKHEAKNIAYGVSKNALNYLIKSLAEEGKMQNFSANAVAPYIIDSEENRKWIDNISYLISTESICKLVQSVFENYKVTTGNIFELPYTINNV